MKKSITNNLITKTTLVFVVSFIITKTSSAQTTFRKLSSGSGFNYGNCIIQTPDKGICIAGSTSSSGSGNYDVFVIKLDSNAVMQWSKTFDWGKNEYGLSAIITEDRGIAITGYANINNFSDSLWDGFVLKLDTTGNVRWCKSLGGNRQDMVNCIIETSNGDLIVAGSTLSYGKGKNDVYISRLTALGALEWSKTLGTTADDIAYAVTATKNGFAIAGVAGNDFMPFVAKCDADGNVNWSKLIAGNSTAIGVFNSMVKTADNGFALTGFTKTWNQGFDVLTAKITTKGNLEWCTTLGNAGDDKGNSIIEDKQGNFVITGYADYARPGYAQSLYMMKIGTGANLLWGKSITEHSDAIGSSVCEWKNNGYIVTGSSWQTAGGALYKPEIYLSRFDSSGGICGTYTTQPGLQVISPYITNLHFYTTLCSGIADNIATHYKGPNFFDNCISPLPVAFATATGESDANDLQLNKKTLSVTIAPNPVINGLLNLRFNNSSSNTLQVSIINMQGNTVFTFKMQPTTKLYNKSINIAALSKGMYMVNVNDGLSQQVLKFVKAN